MAVTHRLSDTPHFVILTPPCQAPLSLERRGDGGEVLPHRYQNTTLGGCTNSVFFPTFFPPPLIKVHYMRVPSDRFKKHLKKFSDETSMYGSIHKRV